jgi:hypothetical protein
VVGPVCVYGFYYYASNFEPLLGAGGWRAHECYIKGAKLGPVSWLHEELIICNCIRKGSY